jgi:hypothetical protein
MPFVFILLGAVAVALVMTSKASASTTPATPPRGYTVELDASLPAALRDQVLTALMTERDPAKLEALALAVDKAFPLSARRLRERAAVLRASAPPLPSAPVLPTLPPPSVEPTPGAPNPNAIDLDKNLPPAAGTIVVSLLMGANDSPVYLETYGNQLAPQFPRAAYYLRLRSWKLRGSPAGKEPQFTTAILPIEPVAPAVLSQPMPAPAPAPAQVLPTLPPIPAMPVPAAVPIAVPDPTLLQAQTLLAHWTLNNPMDADPADFGRVLGDISGLKSARCTKATTTFQRAVRAKVTALLQTSPGDSEGVWVLQNMLVNGELDAPTRSVLDEVASQSIRTPKPSPQPAPPVIPPFPTPVIPPSPWPVPQPVIPPAPAPPAPAPVIPPAPAPPVPTPVIPPVPQPVIPSSVSLDPGMPPQLASAVQNALALESDPAKLQGFAATMLPNYPNSYAALMAKASLLRGLPPSPSPAPSPGPGPLPPVPVIPPAPVLRFPLGDARSRSGRNATRPTGYAFIVIRANVDRVVPWEVAQLATGDAALHPVLAKINPHVRPKGDWAMQANDCINVPWEWALKLATKFLIQQDPTAGPSTPGLDFTPAPGAPTGAAKPTAGAAKPTAGAAKPTPAATPTRLLPSGSKAPKSN